MSSFKKLMHSLKEGTLLFSLEIHQSDTTISYLLVKAKLIKNELEILENKEFIKLEEVFTLIPKNSQLFLIYNTAQVIKKTVPLQKDLFKAIKQAFPNLQPEDFYYEGYFTELETELALCRKAPLDEIIKICQDNKIYVTGWSLNSILYKSLENKLKEATLNTEEKYLIAFSGNYTEATSRRFTEFSFDDNQTQQKNVFYNERFYSLGLPATIVILLGLLIINFLFFNSYYSNIEELRQLNALNNSQRELALKLTETVAKKEKLLKDVQQSKNSKTSYYIDQISSGLPQEILLQKLEYQPATKAIKSDQAIELEDLKIFIEGESKDNRSLSLWISELENLPFATQVNIGNLEQTPGNLSKFQLILILQE
ncbi:PilN domain-containing protein [Leeuwenhoekiella sp. H156]|uniref:PilN domain-containing protein n=1 Tax=Leeuwenhoekiella sp. H156 TaxID=3450128 RepID=UPI003FA43501